MEQHTVLGHHAQGVARAPQTDVANVLPINQNGPLVWIIEAQQQFLDRRLPRPRRPDQRCCFAAGYNKAQIAQNRAFGSVIKGDTFERKRPVARHQICRAGLVVDGIGDFEQGHHALGVAQAVEDAAVDDAQAPQRLEQAQDQRRQRHKPAHGQRAGGNLGHGDGEQGDQGAAENHSNRHLSDHEVD